MNDARVIVTIYSQDGSCVNINPEQEGDVRAAIKRYLNTGKTRDELIDIDLCYGGCYAVLVSDIRSLQRNTERERAYAQLIIKQNREELQAHRQEHGVPFDES